MLYFFNAPLQLFLNFMPDHSYFSMIFFRSHSTVSIYWLPNANKRKTTCGFHEPKSLCKFIILLYFCILLYLLYFIVNLLLFFIPICLKRMRFLPFLLLYLPQPSAIISTCKVLPKVMVYSTHQVLQSLIFK